jgi:SPP1 family predicted phage head-tail adaptor
MARTPAGDRDKRIEFQRETVTKSGLGVDVPSWSLVQKAWAKVLFGTGNERRQAASEGASMTATFRVLVTTELNTVTERDRIWFRDIAWGITSIAEIGRAEFEFTAVAAKG